MPAIRFKVPIGAADRIHFAIERRFNYFIEFQLGATCHQYGCNKNKYTLHITILFHVQTPFCFV